MPIYEYDCQACGRPFEALVRGGKEPQCPACGSERLLRRLSVVAAHSASPAPPPCERPGGGCGSCGCRADF